MSDVTASGRSRGEAYRSLRDELWEDYLALCRIPSVASLTGDNEGVRHAASSVAGLLGAVDLFEEIRLYDYGSDTGPVSVVARRAPAAGRATVGLYAHLDVQPAGDPDAWSTPDPFEPEMIDGRLVGRGVVDDAAGVFAILAALRTLREEIVATGLGVVVFLEGEEELGSPRIDSLLADIGDLLEADEFLVLDAANADRGRPAVTVSLRGSALLRVRVRPLSRPVHSGGSGGVLPDAALVFSRIVSGLYDDGGRYAISTAPPMPVGAPVDDPPGLRGALHGGARSLLDRGLLAQTWYGYSATVCGIDALPIEWSSNTLLDEITFLLNLRVPPGAVTATAVDELLGYLGSGAWWGVEVSTEIVSLSEPYAVDADSTAVRRLRDAVREVRQQEPEVIGIGGSIGVVAPLAASAGRPDILLVGVGNPTSRAHSVDEGIEPSELDLIALTVIDCLDRRLAETAPQGKETP